MRWFQECSVLSANDFNQLAWSDREASSAHVAPLPLVVLLKLCRVSHEALSTLLAL